MGNLKLIRSYGAIVCYAKYCLRNRMNLYSSSSVLYSIHFLPPKIVELSRQKRWEDESSREKKLGKKSNSFNSWDLCSQGIAQTFVFHLIHWVDEQVTFSKLSFRSRTSLCWCQHCYLLSLESRVAVAFFMSHF